MPVVVELAGDFMVRGWGGCCGLGVWRFKSCGAVLCCAVLCCAVLGLGCVWWVG